MNTLDLIGKRVRFEGEVGTVVSRTEPSLAGRDCLSFWRGRSVTIRVEGALAPHFVEVAEADIVRIEMLEN